MFKKLKAKVMATLGMATALVAVPMVVAASNPVVPDITEVMTSGMQGVVNQVMSILAAILPIGLMAVGTFIAVRWGIGFIRNLLGR